MYNPNDADDPVMDDELQIGEQVLFAEEYFNADGKPAKLRKDLRGVELTVKDIASGGVKWDYHLQYKDEEFYVRYWEITRAPRKEAI